MIYVIVQLVSGFLMAGTLTAIAAELMKHAKQIKRKKLF